MIFSLVDGKLCLKVSKANKDGSYLPTFNFSGEHTEVEPLISEFLKKMDYEKGYIEQLYTFIEENLIQIGYIVLLNPISGSTYTSQHEWRWATIKRIPPLKKAHIKVKEMGLQRLKNKVAYSRIAVRLLDNEFTLNDLQHVYEQILGESIDKRNFRKKMESKHFVKPTDKFRRGSHRPARLYKIGPKSKTVPL